MADKDLQSPGREANDALPLGERHGLVSDKKTKEIGEAETRSAGPDGPDAKEAAKIVQPPSKADR